MAEQTKFSKFIDQGGVAGWINRNRKKLKAKSKDDLTLFKKNGKKTSTTAKRTKKPTGKKAMRAANVERFGEATVKRLGNKTADFKKMRSGKMSKEAFIAKYPNSITAREAAKRKKKSTTRKSRFADSNSKKKLTNDQIKYPTRGTFRGI